MVRTVTERLRRWGRARGGPASIRHRKGRNFQPACSFLESRWLLSVNIQIDYSYDTTNFFNTPAKRYLIQLAASELSNALSKDQLSAISPSGNDVWSASFMNPATGATQQVSNLSVPANTIIVYVGGRSLGSGSEAGDSSVGGYSATGDTSWLNTVAARGKTGALAATPTSFGPWGGSIAFDTGSTNWFFGNATAGLGPNQTDFFTVAEHELGHILGLGTSDAWFSQISGNTFIGPAATAVYGGPVPLNPGHDHWADGTQSDGTNAVMDPVLYGGSRLMFTDLDYAALADIGWVVQPPPQTSNVSFSASRETVNPAAGSVTLTVDRTGGLGAFSVNYSTSDGTARAGVAYQPVAGTLYFDVAQTSQSISVPLVAGASTSGINPLNFTVTLSGPSRAVTLGTSAMTVTISNATSLNPEPAPVVVDDFFGNGTSNIGVFRPSTAQWFLMPPSGQTWAPPSFGGGNLLDIPVPGDYLGNGQTQLAVFRPSTGQWFIDGLPQPISFGGLNMLDIPVPGDYLGNGQTQLAVFRPSTGQWFIDGLPQPISFGGLNMLDIPVPGDYLGNGQTQLAVFRPSTGQWFIDGLPQPISFGGLNMLDIPVPGDYDHTGHTEVAVFRPSTAQWFIGGHAQPISFGAANYFDLPIETSIGSLIKLGLIGGNTSGSAPLISAAQVTVSGSGSSDYNQIGEALPIVTAENGHRHRKR